MFANSDDLSVPQKNTYRLRGEKPGDKVLLGGDLFNAMFGLAIMDYFFTIKCILNFIGSHRLIFVVAYVLVFFVVSVYLRILNLL